MGTLRGHVPDKLLNSFQKRIDDFEFEAAAIVSMKIKAALESTDKGKEA